MTDANPQVRDDGRVVCHDCADSFDRIGAHWVQGDCSWPRLTDRQQAICRGLTLGDGTINDGGSTPSLSVYVARRPFLEWVGDELDWLVTDVFAHRSAEASASYARSAGHDADVGDYSTIYGLRTRVHRWFDGLAAWYVTRRTGRRRTVPPPAVDLGPVDLAVWYACDGSLHYDSRYPSSRPYITIGVNAFLEHRDPCVLEDWFDPVPADPTVDAQDGSIRCSVDQTETLLAWMDGPLRGYEHKWVGDDYEGYQSERV